MTTKTLEPGRRTFAREFAVFMGVLFLSVVVPVVVVFYFIGQAIAYCASC